MPLRVRELGDQEPGRNLLQTPDRGAARRRERSWSQSPSTGRGAEVHVWRGQVLHLVVRRADEHRTSSDKLTHRCAVIAAVPPPRDGADRQPVSWSRGRVGARSGDATYSAGSLAIDRRNTGSKTPQQALKAKRCAMVVVSSGYSVDPNRRFAGGPA
jgi:hypothetical protein